VPESAVYAAALARQQPLVFESVDRFVAPSRYAAGQLALLGLPAERTVVLPHYLPAESLADQSGADRGSYALIAARLAEEKGIDVAIRAAAGRAPRSRRCAGSPTSWRRRWSSWAGCRARAWRPCWPRLRWCC
jgi:hypothetical protein